MPVRNARTAKQQTVADQRADTPPELARRLSRDAVLAQVRTERARLWSSATGANVSRVMDWREARIAELTAAAERQR